MAPAWRRIRRRLILRQVTAQSRDVLREFARGSYAPPHRHGYCGSGESWRRSSGARRAHQWRARRGPARRAVGLPCPFGQGGPNPPMKRAPGRQRRPPAPGAGCWWVRWRVARPLPPFIRTSPPCGGSAGGPSPRLHAVAARPPRYHARPIPSRVRMPGAPGPRP